MCSITIRQRANLVFRACPEVDKEPLFGFCFERSFVKNPSNSLKTFRYFATLLQNDRRAEPLPAFEGLREAFFKVPLRLFYNFMELSLLQF